MNLITIIIMLSFFNTSPEDKLKTYEDINKTSYLKFKPLKSNGSNDNMQVDYTSVFNPKDYLKNISAIKSTIDTTTRVDNTQKAKSIPVLPDFFQAEQPAMSADKIAVNVKKGDSIKNYTDKPFFKSIVNLNIPKNDKAYLIQMAYLESRFNPQADNKRGYKGAYQFGKTALKEVDMSKKSYMSDMNNQHSAALKLKESNLNMLKKYKKYIGQFVHGIRITENGIAAGAHLVGASAVKNFLERGIIEKDGNGTPITKYFSDFSNAG